MPIAAKRLSGSDLTLFRSHYGKSNASKQKSININADVFLGEIYPNAMKHASGGDAAFPVDLYIHGPAGRETHRLSRKIIKNSGYKNWRLDGELIPAPEDAEKRYDDLKTGDIVVFRFTGDPIPTVLEAVLLSSELMEDQHTHEELDRLIPGSGRKSMITLNESELKTVLDNAQPTNEHPIWLFVEDPSLVEDIAEAAAGDVKSLGRVRTKQPRKVSKKELLDARAEADRIGAEGEGLVAVHLQRQVSEGRLDSYNWVSQSHAVSPFDFSLQKNSEEIEIDVKTTCQAFERPFHVSGNELRHAATSPRSYQIYRVYGLNEDGAMLRRSENFQELAKKLVEHFNTLEPAITVTGVTISSDQLIWSDEEKLEPADE